MSGAISADLAAALRAVVDLRQTQQRGRLSAIGANYVPALRQAGQGELADRLLAVTTDLVGDAERPGNLALLRSEIEGLLLGATIVEPPAPDPEPEPEPEPEPPASTWPFPDVPEPVLPTGLQVVTQGSYAARDGMEYRGLSMSPNIAQRRVVLRDCDLGWLGIAAPAEDVWIIGGDLGPLANGVHPQIASGFQREVAKRVVLDGVRIHGMTRSDPSQHTEGLQVGGVEVLVLRRCVFDSNHVMNLFLRCWSPAPIRYVLIEDCDLGRVGSGSFHNVLISGAGDSSKPTDVHLRRNRHVGPITVDGAVRVTFGQGADANIPVAA